MEHPSTPKPFRQPPAAPLLSPAPRSASSSRRILVWKDGIPTVEIVAQQVKEVIPDVLVSALLEPFEDDLGIYPEYEGLTKLEVMAKNMATNAAHGGIDSANQMLDRILGKPKQSSESKNLNVTYQDFLNELERRNAENEVGK